MKFQPQAEYEPPDPPSVSTAPAPALPRRGKSFPGRVLPAVYLAFTGLAWLALVVLELLGLAGFVPWGIPAVETVLAAICIVAGIGAFKGWRLAPSFYAWLGFFSGGWAGVRTLVSGSNYVALLVVCAGLLVIAVVLGVRNRLGESRSETARPGFDGPDDAAYRLQPHAHQELLQVGRDQLPPMS